jgi:serine/threonine protein kinase
LRTGATPLTTEPLFAPPKIGPYQLLATIGSGAFATVKLAYRHDVSRQYACKIICKDRMSHSLNRHLFEREIRILQQLRHPRIARLYDLFQDSLNYYVVMEYCPNGELFSRITGAERLGEAAARVLFRDLLGAVAYLHGRDVAHRDIKPENILLDAESNVKLSDFGLAKYVGDAGVTATPCGSPSYAAPEVFHGRPYDPKKSDLWSCGVVLFAMVTGRLPWTERNQAQLVQQITRGFYCVPPSVSAPCADLIRALMTVAPDARLGVADALDHAWLQVEPRTASVDGEVPIVSLHKVDAFFERDGSDLEVGTVRRALSQRGRTFAQELRMITPGLLEMPRALAVKTSPTMRPKMTLSQGANYGGMVPVEETAAWRRVLHARARAPGVIMRPVTMPKAESMKLLDLLKGQPRPEGFS